MSRARLARRRSTLSALLLLGSVCLATILAQNLRARIDLTADREYTLSPALVDMVEGLDDRLQVKLYFNRDVEGAEHLLPQRLSILDRLQEIRAIGGERVALESVDPTTDLLAAREAEHLGVTPVTITDARVGGVSLEQLYQGMELRYLDRSQVIPFVIPDEFEFAFASRLAALLQGQQRPVLGFFSREPLLAPPVPGVDQQASPERIFEEFREILATRYAVRDLPAIGASEPVPEDLVGLVVGRPEEFTADESYALSQYLERGGRILMLVDHEEIQQNQGFASRPIRTGLDNWLKQYGITVHEHLIYDPRCRSVPVDVQWLTAPDGTRVQNPIYHPYGLYPVIREEGLNHSHVVTAQLEEADLIWAHPVVFQQPQGTSWTAETLLRTSDQARALPADVPLALSRSDVQLLDARAAREKTVRAFDLAIAVRGTFQEGAPEGLLVVIGDTDAFQNPTLAVAESNRKLTQNLVDWLAADERLISLRTRGNRPRLIRDFYEEALTAAGGPGETEAEARERDRAARRARDRSESLLSWGNVILPPVLLALAALGHFGRRRALASRRSHAAGGNES